MSTADPARPLAEIIQIETVTLQAVLFDNEQSRTPRPWDGPLVELVGRRHLLRAQKKGTPAFSPATYAEGARRGKSRIIHATALVLDFDHLSSEAAEQVHRGLRGRAFVAYSSYSHGADGEDDRCFRVVLPVGRPILPDEYTDVWDGVNGALSGLADRNARDIARIWFVASCPPERSTLAFRQAASGRLLDVDRVLDFQRGRGKRLREPVGEQEPLALGLGVIGEGERNATLTSLAGAMRRRGMGEAGILAAIRAENETRCAPPLDDGELVTIAHSVTAYDPGNPLLVCNRTDYGNGERLAWFCRDDLRYVHPWESWLIWDGRRWACDTSDRAFVRAGTMIRALAAQAETVGDAGERDALRDHALRSESVPRLVAAQRVAANLLGVSPQALDQRPDLLNCKNGTVNLETGAITPHDRAHLLTKLAPVELDPDATCPIWEAFLSRVLDGNAALIAFVQRAVGYSLTGLNGEHALFLCIGTGANGKSTFIETLRVMFGDYAANAEFATFLKRDAEGARNDIARLSNTRLVSASEPERGKPLAESVVKLLTGEDAVTVRFLYQEYFEFLPTFKIWLAANHRPSIQGSDQGIWRRIRVIPFNVTIPPEERDKKLKQKLLAELPGILAWAMRGLASWREQGLGAPSEVLEATEDYRELMDPLPAFLEGYCERGAGFAVTAKELYTAYLRWAEESGEPPLTQKGLAHRLQDHGLRPARGAHGVRAWRGLRLREGVMRSGGQRAHQEPPPSAWRPEDDDYEEGDV